MMTRCVSTRLVATASVAITTTAVVVKVAAGWRWIAKNGEWVFVRLDPVTLNWAPFSLYWSGRNPLSSSLHSLGLGTVPPRRRRTLIIVQRHGQANKNVDLKKPKKSAIEAARRAASEDEKQGVIKRWLAIAQHHAYFDDPLNETGASQAKVAGGEIARLAASIGACGASGGILRVSSPFRRALQTQLLVASRDETVVAHDLIGETPYNESACRRRSKDAIETEYGARVDATFVDPNGYPTQDVDHVTASLAGDDDLKNVMAPRIRAFVDDFLVPRLLGGQYRAVWITSHKGTSRLLIHHLTGKTVRLENAEAFVFSM